MTLGALGLVTLQRQAVAEAPVRHSSLAETAYETIKRAIIRCDLEPGRYVSEAYLAERFQLSRAVVRPALKRLYQEQLVQTDAGQRYLVPSITLKDAYDLFELRLMLEPAAARKAAGRLDAAQLARLTELCRAQYEPGNRESAEAFLLDNREFHVTVARASGNALMAEVIANVLDREERLNHLAHVLQDRNDAACHEHQELLDALIARDGERAEKVMADGVADSRRFVIDALMSSPSILTTNVTVSHKLQAASR
jgi:DNA-binding GntR family transcriptional regulator